MSKIKKAPGATQAKTASENVLFTRIGAALGWATMAVLFAAVAWSWPLSSLSVELGNWYLAKDYQAVTATPIEREGKDQDGRFKWFAARYEVAGKSLETGRMTLLEDEAIDVPANAAVMKTLENAFNQKQTVTVWVSPRDPGVALVSRELSMQSVSKRALFGGAFALIALAGVLGFVTAALATSHYAGRTQAGGVWALVAALWIVVLPVVWALLDPNTREPITLVIAYLLGAMGLVAIGYGFYCLFKRS